MITTPSGGQVLLDKGYYEITGLAWSGRGKIKRVDVSIDGGRNWRTARLQEPVLTKALTRFRIDWIWDGSPALLQSRAIDETGYVQPTLRQLRAVRGTRSIYHNNAIQTWQRAGRTARCGMSRSPDALRCCPRRGRALATAALARRPRQATRRATASAAPPTPQEIAGLGHRRAARRSRACRKGRARSRRARTSATRKCATCHGTFGESNELLSRSSAASSRTT